MTPLHDGVSFFDSREAQEDLAEVEARVAALDHVLGVTKPTEEIAAGGGSAAAGGSVSPDGRIALIRVQYPVIEELDAGDLASLKELGAALRETSSLQVEMGGDLFFAFEEAETGTGEMIGVLMAVIILLVAFGSFIAMGLPIGLTLFGLALGISSMSLITYLIDIPSWAPQMASMIGLGVGIDYALFLVTRHREFLARGATVEESVGRAVATAGLAVIFAGGTVVIAILGLAVAEVPFMTAAGVATSVIVLIMVVASVTLLPAFLGLAGTRISRVRFRRHRAGSAAEDTSGWHRWGAHVTQHPWAYVAGGTAVLLVLAAPALALRIGTPDEGSLPPSRTERRAYDLVAGGLRAGHQRSSGDRHRHLRRPEHRRSPGRGHRGG